MPLGHLRPPGIGNPRAGRQVGMRAAVASLRRFYFPMDLRPASSFSGQRQILPEACRPPFSECGKDVLDVGQARDAAPGNFCGGRAGVRGLEREVSDGGGISTPYFDHIDTSQTRTARQHGDKDSSRPVVEKPVETPVLAAGSELAQTLLQGDRAAAVFAGHRDCPVSDNPSVSRTKAGDASTARFSFTRACSRSAVAPSAVGSLRFSAAAIPIQFGLRSMPRHRPGSTATGLRR